jgi:hypothetical protein
MLWSFDPVEHVPSGCCKARSRRGLFASMECSLASDRVSAF